MIQLKLWFSQSFINCGTRRVLSALCLPVPSIIWECRPDLSWSLLIYWSLSQTHILISLSPRARPSIPCVLVSSSHHFHFTASDKHPQHARVVLITLNTAYILHILCFLSHCCRRLLLGLVLCLLQDLICLHQPELRHFTHKVNTKEIHNTGHKQLLLS